MRTPSAATSFLITLATALIAVTVHAKTFTNSYISFELPDKWDCALDQTEWVCRPSGAVEQQQAIIILTAKEVGPGDSLPAYKDHLKTPKQIQSRAGTMITSEVLTVDEKKIADQPWIDGMHKSSEVPNYITRYLATTRGKIAVLVTFSAHTLYYSKYSADFLRAIGSLRVIASATTGRQGGGGGDGPFGTASNVDLTSGDVPAENDPTAAGGGGGLGNKTRLVLVLAILLAGIGLYLMLKKGQKKKKR